VNHDLTLQFEQIVLPHLDAGFNLARWLTGNDRDAEDVTQDACVRALKFFSGFRGSNARAWFLTVVRHTSWTWLRRERGHREEVEFDEELHGGEDLSTSPETVLTRKADIAAVRQAIETLAPEFREVLILRELEDCAYKEIAEIAGIPVGTVMSRLARARHQLQTALAPHPYQGGCP
jgi:RNA polymerase sigma-70 factor (ECF subfamily)